MAEKYTDFEISKLKQRYIDINNNIKKYNNEIDKNNKEINKINKRIDELVVIKINLKKSRDKFYQYIDVKRNKFEKLRNDYFNTKFARCCSEEMLDYINARETTEAADNIDSAISNVENKSKMFDLEISDLKSENIRLENMIHELEYEKKLILQKGVI